MKPVILDVVLVFIVRFVLITSLSATRTVGKGVIRLEDDLGPTLNVHSPYLVVKANSTFTLTCEGKRPIAWNTTVRLEGDDRVIVHENRLVKRYKTTITINEILYKDSGQFSCYYTQNRTSSSISAFHMQSTSVYIYVTDPGHLFVPVGMFEENMIVIQAVQEGQEGVIPCKPTHPTVNVTLMKYPDQQVYLHPNDLEFDPTRGFIVKYPNIFYNGLFECKASNGRTTQDLNLHLIWFENSGRPPRPRFEHRLTKMNLHTGEFSLSCSVNVESEEGHTVTWTYPNPTSTNIRISPTVQERVQSPNGYSFSVLRSTLEVSSVDTADGGRYACHVTNENGLSESAEVYIPIESPARIVNSNLDGSVLSIIYGFELQLLCQAEGYPKPVLEWSKDGRVIDPTSSRRYDFLDQHSKLIIDEILPTDGGKYGCVAQNRAGTASRNVTVLVIEPEYSHDEVEAVATESTTAEIVASDAKALHPAIHILGIGVACYLHTRSRFDW